MRRRHAQRCGCPPQIGYPGKANERGLMAHHAYSSTHGSHGACERAAMCRLCPPASGACRARCDSSGRNGRCLLHVVCRMSHGVCSMCYHARFCVTGRALRSERSNAQRAREGARGVRVLRVPRGVYYCDHSAPSRSATARSGSTACSSHLCAAAATTSPVASLGAWGLLWGTVWCRVVVCGSLWSFGCFVVVGGTVG